VRNGGGKNVKRNERHGGTPRLDIRRFVCKQRAKRALLKSNKIK
jgi:hypothetical protein